MDAFISLDFARVFSSSPTPCKAELIKANRCQKYLVETHSGSLYLLPIRSFPRIEAIALLIASLRFKDWIGLFISRQFTTFLKSRQ